MYSGAHAWRTRVNAILRLVRICRMDETGQHTHLIFRWRQLTQLKRFGVFA
jgi:hypothetical protein